MLCNEYGKRQYVNNRRSDHAKHISSNRVQNDVFSGIWGFFWDYSGFFMGHVLFDLCYVRILAARGGIGHQLECASKYHFIPSSTSTKLCSTSQHQTVVLLCEVITWKADLKRKAPIATSWSAARLSRVDGAWWQKGPFVKLRARKILLWSLKIDAHGRSSTFMSRGIAEQILQTKIHGSRHLRCQGKKTL